MKNPFFNKSNELIVEINKFLDVVDKSALIFKKGIKLYFDNKIEQFNNILKEVTDLENRADEYQSDIRYKLYKYMLIPESRGDVLELLESIDNVVDLIKKVIIQFSIENPKIPNDLKDDFLSLTEQSVNSIDELVKGVRAYFEQISLVNDYINKVHFYEHEADELEELIERKVFNDDSIDELSYKFHIRDFVKRIARLSDKAENVSDELSVAAIKRRF